jgi:hypothetical protein
MTDVAESGATAVTFSLRSTPSAAASTRAAPDGTGSNARTGSTMAIKIGKKIKSYSVAKPDDKPAAPASVTIVAGPEEEDAMAVLPPAAEVIQMHEKLERPDRLIGDTYKIKSPLFEHALYVTINDIVLNEGTAHEQRRPFEIFINSKNMDHFQWIVALTRIMRSARWSKGISR